MKFICITYKNSLNLIFHTEINTTGGIFGGTDISKVMTEVQKIEPKFSSIAFTDFCKNDMIPNILEALARGDEKILLDWCYEGVGFTLNIIMK